MSLALFKTDDKDLSLMQTSWKSSIDPVITNPLVNGVLQKGIKLSAGVNSVNHKLGRNLQGYIIVGMHGNYSQIYDTTSLNPSLTLSLNSSVDVVIDLYCF